MDAIERMLLFRDLIDSGSFTAVGQRWGCSHSTVSRQIQALETELSTRLLARTTRSMAMTAEGKVVYAAAARLRVTLDEMRDQLDEARGVMQGELRVVSLVHLARHLVQPAIAACIAEHPQLRIHFSADDGRLDPVRDQPDVAVRVGGDQGGSMTESHLLANHVCLAATPAFMQRYPDLSHPQELSRVPTVAYMSSVDTITSWRYYDGEDIHSVTVDPVLRVADGNLLADAVCAGAGIGYLSAFAVREEFAAGRLVQVLPGWRLPPYAPVIALTSTASQHSPRVEVFLKHLRQVAQRLRSTASD